MSHRELLMRRMNESIEAGHYRLKGEPRPKESTKRDPEDRPAPKPEPEARREPAPSKHDVGSFVGGLASRKASEVGANVQRALDERFKKGKK